MSRDDSTWKKKKKNCWMTTNNISQIFKDPVWYKKIKPPPKSYKGNFSLGFKLKLLKDLCDIVQRRWKKRDTKRQKKERILKSFLRRFYS